LGRTTVSHSGRGVHFCLGVVLARMEARTVFSAMLLGILLRNSDRADRGK
jgi:cytochrome P450